MAANGVYAEEVHGSSCWYQAALGPYGAIRAQVSRCQGALTGTTSADSKATQNAQIGFLGCTAHTFAWDNTEPQAPS